MNNNNNEPNKSAHLPAVTERAELDAHGYDPADYKWVPVLRRSRADGWTPQRQVEFIAALADCGCVEQAAREVSMSARSCYRLRRAPGAENFAAAWDAAIVQAVRKLLDVAVERAFNGSDEPVFDRNGNRVGRRMRTNDRMVKFLLRGFMPHIFGQTGSGGPISGGEPAMVEPLAEALKRLAPVAPEAPHLLMAPDELDIALHVADALPGELPHWHRGRAEFDEGGHSPLSEEFEQSLAQAKIEADASAGLGSRDQDEDEASLG
jgi:hypothetical protein